MENSHKEYEVINQRTIFGKRTLIIEKTGSSDGCITLFWVPILLFFLFSLPMKILDKNISIFNFKLFNFSWFKESNIWIFCSSVWVVVFMILALINYFYKNKTFEIKNFFSFPKSYFTINLFILSIAVISLFVLSKYQRENIFFLYASLSLIEIFFLKLFIEKADKNKLKHFLISSILIFSSSAFLFFQLGYDVFKNSENPQVQKENTEIKFKIISDYGEKLSIKPKFKSKQIVFIPQNSEVFFQGDSIVENDIVWYKINYNNNWGWIRKIYLGN